jgi:DNA-binding NarL/FixJ family response regulator
MSRVFGRGFFIALITLPDFLLAIRSENKESPHQMNARIEIAGLPITIERVLLLTDQEFRVFKALGDGYSTAEIAEAPSFKLSVKTIESYVMNIKAKLNIKSACRIRSFAAKYNQLCELTHMKRVARSVPPSEYAKFEFKTTAA